MFTEGQRVAIGQSQIEARFVRIADDEETTGVPEAMICFDDGTLAVVPCDDLRAL
jgi:hypothetical protein